MAAPFLPERSNLKSLREAVQGCRGCDLWEGTTQAVFGEGRKGSAVMFIGEQPGDREDRQGKPFVGPAGRELDKALEAVGIDRDDVYITNVVKHFKFEERGRRRLHKTPKKFEIDACRPWLDEELRVIKPEALIVLGATAAKALFGGQFRITKDRGKPLDSDLAPLVIATVHPSSILRAPDDAAREQAREAFTEDLRTVAEELAKRR